ncbi:MAG: hypothetical protein GYA24_20100 [Candidatus Lokiarchaeota archaeon]|nr:hypothetical protein [Candidatus Lokiarchaeota archaeon]
MLIDEIFSLTNHLCITVQQQSTLDHANPITREYIEAVADHDKVIKNHVARDLIIDRVYFDV